MNEFVPASRLRGIEKSAIRRVFDRARPGSINLGLGEPDLPTPEIVKRAAVAVITQEQNGYTLQAGLPSLRAIIAAEYPHLNLNPDQVIVTAGSQEALYLSLLTLVDEGDEVLLPNPGFVAYATIVRIAGGIPRFYRLPSLGGFTFDYEDFRKTLSARVRAVVLTSPSNPTGRVLSAADMQSIAELLSESRAYVICDEIYRDLYYTAERPVSFSQFNSRAIVISGLSKSMNMTGWRLGWMCGETDVIRSALVLHGYVTTCASAISQKAALVCWTDEAALARERHRQTFRERRDHLLHLIRERLGLDAVMPDGAFYTMVDINRYGSSQTVAETLLDHGVITVPGGAFGSEAEGFLRVSFCADLAQLSEGVERMANALRNL